MVVGQGVEVVGERDRFSLLASVSVTSCGRAGSWVEGSLVASVYPAGMQGQSVRELLKLQRRDGLITAALLHLRGEQRKKKPDELELGRADSIAGSWPASR